MDTLLVVALALLVIFFLGKTVVMIRPHQKGLVERLGKFHRQLEPGIHFIIPFIDRVIKIDMRERVVDVPPQEVITRDNVVVTVDGIIYYRVMDPQASVYRVGNFVQAAVNLAQTNLRNIIGELSLDETLTSRELINTRLRTVLDEATDAWGVKVTRVELKRIEPPADVTEAMHKQMKAEREKRAMILEAEGYRESEIQRAEGVKQSEILKAEGKARSMQLIADAKKYQLIREAEGQAEAWRTILKALRESAPNREVITLQYLEALKRLAEGQATKLIVPVELSGLASLLELARAREWLPSAIDSNSGESASPPSSTANPPHNGNQNPSDGTQTNGSKG